MKMNNEPDNLISYWGLAPDDPELFELFDGHINEPDVDIDEWPHTFTPDRTFLTDSDDPDCYTWGMEDPFSPENLRIQPVFPDFLKLVEEAESRSYGT